MTRRIGLALLMLLPVSACDRADAGVSDGPIVLGVAGPLEQASGQSMLNAAQMAAEEINTGGGIDGRPIELRPHDDGADAARAIQVATRLRDDPQVVAVVGHINSGATLAAAPVYNDPAAPVVAVSPASSSPAISTAGPWTFRVCPSDLQHGPALAAWAASQLGARRTLIVYANDDYGRGVLRSFGESFASGGGAIVSADPFLPALVRDSATLAPYLERGMRRRVDAIMVAGQADEGRRLLEAGRLIGFDGPVLGADGMTGLRDAGVIAEGVYISSAFLPDRPTPEAQRFVAAYQERYGQLPDHRAAMTYDAVLLLARAIGEVGTERRAIRDYLDQVGRGHPTFEGVSGTIAFDENGDVSSKEVAIGVVRDGRLVSAPAR